jgi:hypothetical protein
MLENLHYASCTRICSFTSLPNTSLCNKDSANLGTANSPRVEITIQNLMYVGQQIFLPDQVTSGIVKMAVNGDMSLLTYLFKMYRTTLSSSSSQNLILPIKMARANALF